MTKKNYLILRLKKRFDSKIKKKEFDTKTKKI